MVQKCAFNTRYCGRYVYPCSSSRLQRLNFPFKAITVVSGERFFFCMSFSFLSNIFME